MDSQESSVGVATGYGVDDWGSFPGRDKRFFSTASRPAVGSTKLLSQCVQEGTLSRGKTAEA
jgi:hypothetical protein